jgi:hypothetical protein
VGDASPVDTLAPPPENRPSMAADVLTWGFAETDDGRAA